MTTVAFAYTGTPQSYVVPAGVTSIDLQLEGSAGTDGSYQGLPQAKGGLVTGTLAVTPGETLWIYCGGLYIYGGSTGGTSGLGGGATDVRQGGNDLAHRVAIAGGGGGASGQSGTAKFAGGVGGGITGTNGTSSSGTAYSGKGGTQSAGGAAGASSYPGVAGSLGYGGASAPGSGYENSGGWNGGGYPNHNNNTGMFGGGGGGGYYGGGSGSASSASQNGGGGGGSSYIGGLTNASTVAGGAASAGTGTCVITYADIIPGSLTAVPAIFNLNTAVPIVSIGKSIYSVSAAMIQVALTSKVTGAATVSPPVPEFDLVIPPANITGAASVFAVPFDPITFYDSGIITIYWNGLFAAPAGMTLDMVEPTRSVYIKATPPVYTEMDYRTRFLDPQVRVTRRVEILEADGQTLWEQAGPISRLISGAVSVDYTRDERRSIDLELANFDKKLAHQPEGFWYDKVLKLYRGIEFYDNSGLRSHEVGLGNFLMDKLDYARFPQTVKITARDYTKKCILSKLTQADFYPASTPIETLIGALASNSGCHDRIIPTTGLTLGIDTTYERDKSRWSIMKEVSDSFGYELFFNAQGYLVMREYLDPTLSPVSYEFLTGPTVGNLVDWSKSVNDTRIFNHVSVIGASSDSIPVWGDAYNNNPNSPTSVDNLGSERTQNLEYDFVTSNEQAASLAATFLAVNGLEEYEINMTSLVVPWLETGEIIKFTDPDVGSNEPDRFLLTTLSIPLGLEAMTGTGRRVTIVS